MTELIDLSGYTIEELGSLIERACIARDKLITLSNAEQLIDQILGDVQTALGREPGDPWKQPLGAHDAYPAGAEVSHEGKLWRSILTANVWPPGVSGWDEIVDPDAVPDWRQPLGGHDAYDVGAKVLYDGKTWISTVAGNIWAPGVYGWEEVES